MVLEASTFYHHFLYFDPRGLAFRIITIGLAITLAARGSHLLGALKFRLRFLPLRQSGLWKSNAELGLPRSSHPVEAKVNRKFHLVTHKEFQPLLESGNYTLTTSGF